MAQPGLYSMATAVSTKAKVRGKNKKRKKSTMAGGACATAEVTNLGKNSLILGYTWLQKHNPAIDWQTGVIKFTHCPRSCLMLHNRVKRLATLDDEEREGLEYIHQAKVEAPVVKKPVRTPEELVPQCYHSYLDIFSEKAASRFPLRKPWDHAIDLKDTFKPKKG